MQLLCVGYFNDANIYRNTTIYTPKILVIQTCKNLIITNHMHQRWLTIHVASWLYVQLDSKENMSSTIVCA